MKNDNATAIIWMLGIAALILMFGYKFLGLPGLIFIIVGVAAGITLLVKSKQNSSQRLKLAGFAMLIIAVVGSFSIKTYIDRASVDEQEPVLAATSEASGTSSASGNSATYESCASRLGPGLERCLELPESMWESCRRSYLRELASCTGN